MPRFSCNCCVIILFFKLVMEEIWALQKKLAAVQMIDSAYKLSEQNCIEIISKLVEMGMLEVLILILSMKTGILFINLL